GLEDHVDDAADLDPAEQHGLSKQLFHHALYAHPPWTPNSVSPRGSSQATWTSSTSAWPGPRLHHSTIDATRSSSPSNTASTDPSRLLRTHPPRPSDLARSRASARKNTPWTRPVTTTCARLLTPRIPPRRRGARTGTAPT